MTELGGGWPAGMSLGTMFRIFKPGHYSLNIIPPGPDIQAFPGYPNMHDIQYTMFTIFGSIVELAANHLKLG